MSTEPRQSAPPHVPTEVQIRARQRSLITMRCGWCEVPIGFVGHVIGVVFCSLSCHRHDALNRPKRRLVDDPRAE